MVLLIYFYVVTNNGRLRSNFISPLLGNNCSSSICRLQVVKTMSTMSPTAYVCPICRSTPTCPTITRCHHTFCHECIVTHLESRNTCPICSSFVSAESLQIQNPFPATPNRSSVNPSAQSPWPPVPPSQSRHESASISRPTSHVTTTVPDATPDITAALSSRRQTPPPLLRSRSPVLCSPSERAARRVRAETRAQYTLATNTQPYGPYINPNHNLSNQPHFDLPPSRPNEPYLHPTSSLRHLPTASSHSGSISIPAPPSTIPASLFTVNTSAVFSSSSNTNTDALLAVSDNLTAEQLAGVIANLNRKLQRKERSGRLSQDRLLLHFLRHARAQKEVELRRIRNELELLQNDISATELHCSAQRVPSDTPISPNSVPVLENSAPESSDGLADSRKRQKIISNFRELETYYMNTVGCHSGEHRKRALKHFTDDLFKLTQYSRLRERATLIHVARIPDSVGGDVFRTSNIVSSMEFDRDSEFLATAGVTRRIKIFEFTHVTRNLTDVHYPVREIPSQAKLSWLCWNPFIRHHMVSSDYEGSVKIWDVNYSSVLSEYEEHEMRAWSVDYCPAKPSLVASGSDDGTVKLWSADQRSSVLTIDNKPANVCSVKFHPTAAELLAFGSVDYHVHYFDLRNTREALHVFDGHKRAVSYVKFMSPTELVSASVDSTIMLWDLKSMTLARTFSGHKNNKNFVGLSVTKDFLACGSEDNMVYCYYRAIPPPTSTYKFSSVDPLTGEETTEDDDQQFVSSVCWCPKKPTMLVAANSLGAMKVLQLDGPDQRNKVDDGVDDDLQTQTGASSTNDG